MGLWTRTDPDRLLNAFIKENKKVELEFTKASKPVESG